MNDFGVEQICRKSPLSRGRNFFRVNFVINEVTFESSNIRLT